MLSARACRRCGAPIPTAALAGNCPRCLVTLAISTATGDKSEARAAGGATAPAPQRFFGDYEILGELARGGMGVVYRARQVSLNRLVALKMIAAGQLATPSQVQRFRLEAEAAARLDHPNIVPIYEVGEHQGQHFYSMKLIACGSLAERSAQFQAPPDHRQAATLLAEVARATHFAHQRGILHRDLKPTNILLDADWRPHIADFGLAKLVEDDNSLTQTVAVLGTPAYMAPELASGKAAEATTAADVYSLGAVLYEMLAGRPPFVADNVPALLRKIVEEQPSPPSVVRWQDQRLKSAARAAAATQRENTEASTYDVPRNRPADYSSITLDLDVICLKCLEKEPSRRYPSAAALADDLERWVRGEPIVARAATTIERIHRWARRKPALAGVTLALIVAVLGGLIVSSLLFGREKVARRQAQEELWQAQLAQARAERRSGEAGQSFRSLEALARAAAIRPALELRNEAIAALALTDLRFVPVWTNPVPPLVARFSPDLRRLAAALPDGRIQVSRASDRQEELTLPALSNSVPRAVGFSADGRFLDVLYQTGSNVVWDLTSQQPVLSWGRGRAVGEFTATSDCVLAADNSGLVRCVRLSDGLERWRCLANSNLWTLRAQPQGRYFAVTADNPELEVRELKSGQLVRILRHASRLGTVAWGPDGDHLIVGVESGWLYAWDMTSDGAPAAWRGHDDMIAALGFDSTNRWLMSASWDWTYRLWSLPGYRLGVAARGYSSNGQGGFSSDGQWLGDVVLNQVIGRFAITSSGVLRTLYVPPGDERRGAWSLEVSPNGKLVAAGYGDGLRLLDFASGREAAYRQVGDCRSVLFAPGGDALWSCGEAGLARWPFQRDDPSDVRLGPAEHLSTNELVYGALSGDGRWVAAANEEKACIEVYEVSHTTNAFILSPHAGIQTVVFSPDGRWLASATWNGSDIRIWDVVGRKLVKALPLGRAGLLFSPDSRRLVTSSRVYQVWEVGTWRELYRPSDTGWGVGSVAFSPDGKILAVTRDAHVVQLLVAATGRVLAELDAPGAAPVSRMRFTPDGRSLLAMEWTRGIQVWDLVRLRKELAAIKLDWETPSSWARK